jgi:hypothetical protein
VPACPDVEYPDISVCQILAWVKFPVPLVEVRTSQFVTETLFVTAVTVGIVTPVCVAAKVTFVNPPRLVVVKLDVPLVLTAVRRGELPYVA